MALMQHADAKDEQQRMVCPKDKIVETSSLQSDGTTVKSHTCSKPVLYVHDVGYTFGGGWHWTRPLEISKMDIDLWKKTPVWRDSEDCQVMVLNVPSSPFRSTTISEQGRQFAAELLGRLTRKQIVDIFKVSQIELAGKTDAHGKVVTVADWADAMEAKIREVRFNRCTPE